MTDLSLTGLPPIDEANLPAVVRNGSPADKQAYQTALGFEQVLVQQLTQELVASATSPDGSTGLDGTAGGGAAASGDGSNDGSTGSDPAASEYAQLLPDALSHGIMAGGGTGLALQLTRSLDPTLGEKR